MEKQNHGFVTLPILALLSLTTQALNAQDNGLAAQLEALHGKIQEYGSMDVGHDSEVEKAKTEIKGLLTAVRKNLQETISADTDPEALDEDITDLIDDYNSNVIAALQVKAFSREGLVNEQIVLLSPSEASALILSYPGISPKVFSELVSIALLSRNYELPDTTWQAFKKISNQHQAQAVVAMVEQRWAVHQNLVAALLKISNSHQAVVFAHFFRRFNRHSYFDELVELFCQVANEYQAIAINRWLDSVASAVGAGGLKRGSIAVIAVMVRISNAHQVSVFTTYMEYRYASMEMPIMELFLQVKNAKQAEAIKNLLLQKYREKVSISIESVRAVVESLGSE